MEVAGQRVRRVLQLCLRALQHLDSGGELRVEAGHVGQHMQGAAGERVGVVVGFRDGIERTARRVDQRLRIRQLLVLGLQLGPFVGARRELVEFADLPRETLAFAV